MKLEVKELEQITAKKYKGLFGTVSTYFVLSLVMNLDVINAVLAGVLCWGLYLISSKLVALYPKHRVTIRIIVYVMIIESSYYILAGELNAGMLAAVPLLVLIDYASEKFQGDSKTS